MSTPLVPVIEAVLGQLDRLVTGFALDVELIHNSPNKRIVIESSPSFQLFLTEGW